MSRANDMVPSDANIAQPGWRLPVAWEGATSLAFPIWIIHKYTIGAIWNHATLQASSAFYKEIQIAPHSNTFLKKHT